MAIYTVRDLLSYARGFHHDLAAYYRELDDQSAQEQVHMVLEYLQRHERNLEACLSAYEKDASERVLNTWFMHAPGLEMPGDESFGAVRPDLSVDDVLALALRHDQWLIRLYRQAEQHSVSEGIRDLFRRLLEMAESGDHHLSRDSLETKEL